MTQVTKCQLTTIQSSSPSDASGGGGARSSTSEVSSRWTHACRQSQVLTGEEKSSCRVEQYATWGTRHGETLHLHLIALTLVITWINKFKNQYIDQIHQIRGEGVVGCGYHNDMMYKNILLFKFIPGILEKWETRSTLKFIYKCKVEIKLQFSLLFRHSMSITQQLILIPVYNTTVHKNKSILPLMWLNCELRVIT